MEMIIFMFFLFFIPCLIGRFFTTSDRKFIMSLEDALGWWLKSIKTLLQATTLILAFYFYYLFFWAVHEPLYAVVLITILGFLFSELDSLVLYFARKISDNPKLNNITGKNSPKAPSSIERNE